MPDFQTAYTPISCSFHDHLEHWAVRRTTVEVVWTQDGEEQRATTRIVDVYAQAGADYLKLEIGTVIRLDRLVSVDGMLLPDVC